MSSNNTGEQKIIHLPEGFYLTSVPPTGITLIVKFDEGQMKRIEEFLQKEVSKVAHRGRPKNRKH